MKVSTIQATTLTVRSWPTAVRRGWPHPPLSGHWDSREVIGGFEGPAAIRVATPADKCSAEAVTRVLIDHFPALQLLAVGACVE